MNLHFNKENLMPCVVQDIETNEVLMLAFMNQQSLELTLKTGETWFWSRTNQELWHKGATSGNFQEVCSIFQNCEDNSLLIKVKQTGPACHTGQKSCFYKEVGFQAPEQTNEAEPVVLGAPKGSLEQNFEALMDKAGLKIVWEGYQGFVNDCRIASVWKLRPQDSPVFTARGNLDLAITGQDCVQERGLIKDVIEVAKLPLSRSGNGKVELVLFVRQDSAIQSIDDIKNNTHIATEFPRITAQYFQERNIKVKIDCLAGACEAVARAGFADAGVDIVDSGTTLSANCLRPIAVISKSSAIMIVNPNSWANPKKRKSIQQIRELLLKSQSKEG